MKRSLRVTFVLPSGGRLPVGGFKVVYEYANRLASNGHKVTVVHPSSLAPSANLLSGARSALRYAYRGATGTYRPDAWFRVDENVKLSWVRDLSERNIPDADVIIATAWQSAELAAQYSHSKGEKFYLIQHLETWSGEEKRVYATWKLPLKKIVIARWLQGIAEQLGETAEYIPNGLDFSSFSYTLPVEAREPATAMMLFHRYDWKGSKDGLEALYIVRETIPDLKVEMFGVPASPAGLPSWVHYHCRAKHILLQKLYNHTAVFVAPSWVEGWGLPATEAMMCGAALAATDIGGHREFAIHEETALMSPARNPKLLAENIVRLIREKNLRMKLAKQGRDYVQRFTWQRATGSLESLLLHNRKLGEM